MFEDDDKPISAAARCAYAVLFGSVGAGAVYFMTDPVQGSFAVGLGVFGAVGGALIGPRMFEAIYGFFG